MLLPCVENVGILQLFSIISRSLKYFLFSKNFTKTEKTIFWSIRCHVVLLMHQKIVRFIFHPWSNTKKHSGEKGFGSSSKSPLKEKEILLEMQTSFSSLNCFAMAAKLKLLKAAAGTKRGREKITGMHRDNVKTTKNTRGTEVEAMDQIQRRKPSSVYLFRQSWNY